jgi:nudix-type nucleoside diphosphatase (YffH/AdpP family)
MNLFIYGTLRSPRLAEAVAGRLMEPVPARLDGFEVWTVAGEITPLICPDAGGVTEGAVWLDVPDDVLSRLDLYDGAFGYRLVPVTIRTANGATLDAQVYLPPDDLKAGDSPWSFDDWSRFESFSVHAAEEVFHHAPPHTAETLRQSWPQIQKRAWSFAQAQGAAPPASEIRYDPEDGDLTITEADPIRGQFFGFQSFSVRHRTFQNQRSEVLTREVFIGMEAVMVLPYDAKRDAVLLVEQARMGPAVRGDRNPWTLEPVAGMVDALEDPTEAARREMVEETGMQVGDLTRMTSFYASPGSTTDYFHAYLGTCDLPDIDSWTGGLDSENEDLRLHVLPFAKAMDLIETGEIDVGPLVLMLYWLARNRDRLRARA